jgi:hypothetical protein
MKQIAKKYLFLILIIVSCSPNKQQTSDKQQFDEFEKFRSKFQKQKFDLLEINDLDSIPWPAEKYVRRTMTKEDSTFVPIKLMTNGVLYYFPICEFILQPEKGYHLLFHYYSFGTYTDDESNSMDWLTLATYTNGLFLDSLTVWRRRPNHIIENCRFVGNDTITILTSTFIYQENTFISLGLKETASIYSLTEKGQFLKLDEKFISFIPARKLN